LASSPRVFKHAVQLAKSTQARANALALAEMMAKESGMAIVVREIESLLGKD